ncbi:acetylcholine receptor subunit alpha-L1-like isoform X1 [Daphnia pulex]|uniref:acetylcholine receptor subunit alpha-L1-like isoform X1 n=2 Tax=Daphnia pulex TaxID=6669 RepID=UPI001EDCC2DC|nr:acetylcholine receptor subunit alpha-L1-like isoform X1 [Daphnia pulex]XP_046646940.1 acetylcholine receptor subunit alpha-L1-like isoform X1 [Daphnia pulicaria]
MLWGRHSCRTASSHYYLSTVCSSLILAVTLVVNFCPAGANPDAKRLYDDLLSHYNRLIRPVSNNSEVVTVRLGLHLSQLIDLDLKNQILTTNVWVEHDWMDSKLNWEPDEYGGVEQLIVPSELLWLPDILLYNNADGEYVVTTMTKAILHYDGHVKWNPPAIFKSYCEIDVEWFPFDTQTCFLKFGPWSHNGLQMDLRHINSSDNLVEIGINLKDYYPSVEWDIISVPAERHEKFYECCPNEFYPDIFFNMTLRRKTLFYTVNLIIPCVGISCLSILVFYLPADSGEKVALCISILLSQTMFFLLISEIIPSTSLAVPLLGKYLLFTMFLVGLSVLITIVILNMHYRKPSTHKMAPWVRRIFIHRLPKILLMRVPKRVNEEVEERMKYIANRRLNSKDGRRWSRRVNYGSQLLCEIINFNNLPPPPSPPPPPPPPPPVPANLRDMGQLGRRKRYPLELQKAIRDVQFIRNHMKRRDEYDAEDKDWGFIAMVLDRLFLWLYTIASVIGSFVILLTAPALYDDSSDMAIKYSLVAQQLYGIPDF